MSEILDAALDYIGRGWPVIPLAASNSDSPLTPTIKGWPDTAYRAPEQAIQEWDSIKPHDWRQVGICTGAGLLTIDIDTVEGHAGGADGYAALPALEADLGKLPDTRTHLTPSGGEHRLFTYPPELDIRNSSGKLAPGIDVRAHNGYIVAPPSRREGVAGKPDGVWALELGQPEDPAPLPEAWIKRLLATSKKTDRVPSQGGSGSNDLFSLADFQRMLDADGWSTDGEVHATGDGAKYVLYTRPGKELKSGPSASLFLDSGWLYVHTSNAPHLDAGEPVDAFGYYARTQFGGDFSAARKDLDQQRQAEWLAQPDGTLPPTVVAGSPPDERPWDPEPLTVIHPPIPGPTFPVDIFPEWMTDQIEAVAKALSVPIDLPAVVALGALSVVANANHGTVALTDTWVEGCNLYLAIAMPPGAGKSPVMSVMTHALETIASDMQRQGEDALKRHQSKLRIADKRVKSLEERISKLSDPDEIRQLETDLGDALMSQTSIEHEGSHIITRLLADDFTAEAFVDLLADNGGRMGVISSEGGLFDMLSRYQDKGKATNLDGILKAWSGDRLRTDRKGSGATDVPDPRAAICLTVQPATVARLVGDTEFSERGLVARFMISQPESMVGERDYLNRPKGDVEAAERWAAGLEAMHARMKGKQPAMRLSEAAYRRLQEFQQAMEDDRSGELAPVVEVSMKADGQVARVAALLWAARGNSADVPIDVETIEQGILVARYWISHALSIVATEDLSLDPDVLAAERVLAWLETLEADTFTVRDLVRQGCLTNSHGRRFDQVVPVLELLESCGWIRTESLGITWQISKRGRPAPRFEYVTPSEADRATTATTSDPSNTLSDGRWRFISESDELSRMSVVARKRGFFASSSSSSNDLPASSENIETPARQPTCATTPLEPADPQPVDNSGDLRPGDPGWELLGPPPAEEG